VEPQARSWATRVGRRSTVRLTAKQSKGKRRKRERLDANGRVTSLVGERGGRSHDAFAGVAMRNVYRQGREKEREGEGTSLYRLAQAIRGNAAPRTTSWSEAKTAPRS